VRTGERLDDSNALYRADLVRHRAAYRVAAAVLAGSRVLDLGCGTGYGANALAAAGISVIAIDRVRPVSRSDRAGARFVLGDLEQLPFATSSLDAVASFQVIEHFADAARYLAEIVRVLRPEGVALFTTPNRLQSDGENPHHLREYTASELAGLLRGHFEQVDIQGIHAVGPAARYQAERLRQIRRITRLDPLGLRSRLPRPLVEWGFARLSILVRVLLGSRAEATQLTDSDFPCGPASDDCLDLLAVCRRSRGGEITHSPSF
jgi:SAM-dependent methyltransferase